MTVTRVRVVAYASASATPIAKFRGGASPLRPPRSYATDQYPLPKPEDLFATLARGKVVTKLDLSQAYLQLKLEEDSTAYVTINTHQGLYRYTRLPFLVASAHAMFQKLMDMVLQGIPGAIYYIDDILVSGKDEQSHLKTLETVFKCLMEHGFRLKREILLSIKAIKLIKMEFVLSQTR